MLNFKILDNRPENCEDLQRILKENLEILGKTQVGEKIYADSLGWLDTEEFAGEEKLRQIEELAEKFRKDSDAFVLIGVGGSNNAARSVIEAIAPDDGIEVIYAGKTVSANSMLRMLKQLEGKDYTIDCIAKNFETLEPGVSFRVLRQAMEAKYGEKAADRILATGTFGSSLEQLCRDEHYSFIDFPLTVGGRYTAMTAVGLLPMAVAGVDIRALVKGAHDMQVKLREEQMGEDNIAYQYACLRNLYYRQGLRAEMLSSFEPQFHWFYQWWTQLFAESEGKDGKGILPVTGEFSEQLHSIGQFIQDGSPILFETFLNVTNPEDSLLVMPDSKKDYFNYLDHWDFRDINHADYEATLAAHQLSLPCNAIEIDKIDAYNFGQLFYFFQFACCLSCRIMGVNPFNQPGVEAYKVRMFEALGK